MDPNMDTSNLVKPKKTGVMTRSKGRPKLDNILLSMNESIKTQVRTKTTPTIRGLTDLIIFSWGALKIYQRAGEDHIIC